MWNAESLQSQNVYCCRACTGTLGHPDLDLSRSIRTISTISLSSVIKFRVAMEVYGNEWQ